MPIVCETTFRKRGCRESSFAQRRFCVSVSFYMVSDWLFRMWWLSDCRLCWSMWLLWLWLFVAASILVSCWRWTVESHCLLPSEVEFVEPPLFWGLNRPSRQSHIKRLCPCLLSWFSVLFPCFCILSCTGTDFVHWLPIRWGFIRGLPCMRLPM